MNLTSQSMIKGGKWFSLKEASIMFGAWIWEHVPQGRTKEALGMQKGGEAEL